MPRKKKLEPVISKEELERQARPAVTVGMGLKMSKVSSDNWRAQIRKEDQIRREWVRTHAPELEHEQEESVKRAHHHDEELAHQRAQIKERALLVGGVSKEGQGRALYLKERLKAPPQNKFAGPQTEQQMLGWLAQSSELVTGRMTSSNFAQKSSKPRSKARNVVEEELEAGGWMQVCAVNQQAHAANEHALASS